MLQQLSAPINSYNPPETLKDEVGLFFVERAGQKALVTCAAGHSIVSWEPVGTCEQTIVNGNPPYTITPVTAQFAAALKILGGNLGVSSQEDQRQQRRASGD